MPHSRVKALRYQRALYTGENYQQADEALAQLDQTADPIPAAGTATQRMLEASIMLALVQDQVTPTSLMPPSPRSDSELLVKAVRPTSNGVELYLRPDSLSELWWRLLISERLGQAEGRQSGAQPDLKLTTHRNRIELYRPDRTACVILRPFSRSERIQTAAQVEAAVGTALAAYAERAQVRRWLHQRWTDNDEERRNPQRSLVASELLRRIGLFRDRAAIEWVKSWQHNTDLTAEWLAASPPAELADQLTHPHFGIHSPVVDRTVQPSGRAEAHSRRSSSTTPTSISRDPIGSVVRQSARILIVDDHPIWRRALRIVLESLAFVGEVVEAGSLAEAMRIVQPDDVVVMDIYLPDGDGIEAARDYLVRFPRIRVIVMSTSNARHDFERATAAGVQGYLSKAEDPSTVVEALRVVVEGGSYLDPGLTASTARPLSAQVPSPFDKLSSHQLTILAQVLDGHTSRQIAQDFAVSQEHVKNTLTEIYQELGVAGRMDAAKLMREKGIDRLG